MPKYKIPHDDNPRATTVRVVGDGAGGYRLVSPKGTVLGWIRGRAIGVSGFDDETETIAAATRAYFILAEWLEQQHLHPLPHLGEHAVRCVQSGVQRWITIGPVRIARLLTRSPYDPTVAEHAFEIELRGSIGEGMSIHAALITLRAAQGKIGAADVAWRTRGTATVAPIVAANAAASAALAPSTHLDLEAV